jgi:hypothetical protein
MLFNMPRKALPRLRQVTINAKRFWQISIPRPQGGRASADSTAPAIHDNRPANPNEKTHAHERQKNDAKNVIVEAEVIHNCQ